MKRLQVSWWLAWSSAAAAIACAPTRRATDVAPPAETTSALPFADEIAKFETADRLSPPPRGAVLFVGSSTIRLWPTLAADFPGVEVIQRGFGGSELSDVVRYIPRIVIPYRPRLIVLYAGDNDLAAGNSAQGVFDEYRDFVNIVAKALPETRIVFVSIKPSGSRAALLPQMRAANEMVRQYSANNPRLLYVDVFSSMLDANGAPREDLFVGDRLHMNAKGYSIWKQILDPIVRSGSH